jgi:murein DD-endopeptidase MepM/ murein hydrolase activator NlpD
MKKWLYTVFFILLKRLIQVKRGLFLVVYRIIDMFRWMDRIYRKTLGFWLYKNKISITRRLRLWPVSVDSRLLDILGKRSTLQLLALAIVLFIMYPQSRLYSVDNLGIPGRSTPLYKIVGPGDQTYDVEDVIPNITQAQVKETRSWKEGSIISEFTNVEGATSLETQDIVAVTVGGAALTKPTILPGVKVLETVQEIADEKGRQIILYTVIEGDVLGKIAEKFDINVSTILSVNNLSSNRYLQPGQKIRILPVDGVVHKVARGDNVSRIARLYGASVVDIVEFNRLQGDGRDIAVGEELIIPGGEIPRPKYVPPASIVHDIDDSSFRAVAAPPPSVAAPAGSGYLWPTSVRRITQYFGWRHTGLDIAGPVGTPIYAARLGRVIKSQCGWNGGYGCYTIIDHGGGISTLYGHNSQLYVEIGDTVTQGQTIALMGSTGRSTGSHLHFEVRVDGNRVNPLQYIK